MKVGKEAPRKEQNILRLEAYIHAKNTRLATIVTNQKWCEHLVPFQIGKPPHR